MTPQATDFCTRKFFQDTGWVRVSLFFFSSVYVLETAVYACKSLLYIIYVVQGKDKSWYRPIPMSLQVLLACKGSCPMLSFAIPAETQTILPLQQINYHALSIVLKRKKRKNPVFSFHSSSIEVLKNKTKVFCNKANGTSIALS